MFSKLFKSIPIIVFMGLNCFSQNQIWTVGSQYVPDMQDPNFSIPLPTGPDVTLDYQGQQAQYAANAWHNPVDGSLLFFVVDGVVYDGDGYIIRELIDQSGNGMDLKGVSELSIIPDPENCFRFYVIIDGLTANFIYSTNEFDSEPRPYYAVLNLELERTTYNTNRSGEFEMFPDEQYVRQLMSLVPANSNYFNLASEGTSHIAVSPKTQNDEHFIFYHSSIDIIYTFKLNGAGLTFVQNSVINAKDGNVPPFNYSSPIKSKVKRSELEVVPLANGGFRLVGRTNTYGNQASDKIFKVDYTSIGIPLPYTYLTHLIGLPLETGNHAIPKGIEVSPNKQYIYFTHTTSPSAPKALVCLDINTMTPVALPGITNAQAEPFKYSIIETSSLGVMIANASGIYTILDADNPAIASIDLFLPLTGINQLNLSRMSRTTSNADYDYGLYLLPDQKDFDPNFEEEEELICECCRRYIRPNEFEPGSQYPDYIVNVSQTWSPGNNPFNSANGEVVFQGNLIIRPGVTLNLEFMTLKFSMNSRVIVERDPNATLNTGLNGAILNADGTTFTINDNCNECLWPGIEVQGHYNLPQTSLKHAKVFFQKKTIIEHAYFGTLAGRIIVPDSAGQGYWESFAGGKIQTTDSVVYLNNRHDVYFTPYVYNVTNHSFFRNTYFITDSFHRVNLNEIADLKHAVLKEVIGVKFNSCTFENQIDFKHDGIERGIGIESFNSNFEVTGSNFNQLDYGIWGEAFLNSFTFNVETSNFNDNYNGIFAFNVLRPRIHENNFKVYRSPSNSVTPEAAGIRLTGCNRYIVTKNSLFASLDSLVNPITYGIVVFNSGPYSNVIEENSFYNLRSAAVSAGVNAANYTNPDFNHRGLQWLCNFFTSNHDHDLWVRSGRIAAWQGTCNTNPMILSQPAGNKFFTSQGTNFYHIYLGQNVPQIKYFYNNVNNEMPTITNLANVNIIECLSVDLVCSSGRPGADGQLTEQDLKNLRLQLIDEKFAAKLLLDYSDKDNTINQVLSEYLTPQQKRDMLVSGTTVISDEVLIKYILSYPPHTMLYQVLVHNSPLSDKVIYYMIEESDLTNGMKQQVLYIQNGIPENEAILQHIQNIDLNIAHIENGLISLYYQDSTASYTGQDVVDLIDTNPHKEQLDLELLFHAHVTAKNATQADSLNSILKSINTDQEYAILNDLAVAAIPIDYYTVIYGDSLLIAQLEDLAYNSDYMYAYQARAILSGVLGYKFEYPIDEEFGNRNMILPHYTYDGTPIEIITIFPNPTTDNFFIVFDENADVSPQREARIYDLAGNLQFTRSFDDNAYVLEINTDNMTQGMYIVVISANGVDVGTYKVAVR